MNGKSFGLIVACVALSLLSAGCGPRADTLTPPAEPQISFTTDRAELASGECATLLWSIEAAGSVSLDGRAVDRSGREQVCPLVTTTYTLVLAAGEEVTRRDLVVSVLDRPPPPESPPLPAPPGTGAPSAAAGQAELPDLELARLTFLPEAPDSAEGVELRALVTNRGSADATDFFVDFWIDGDRVASDVIERVSAGAEVELSIRVPPLPAGKHAVQVIAVPDGWTGERAQQESALIRDLTVTAAELPDLTVEGLTVFPGNPAPGETVTLGLSVRNNGKGPAENVVVSLFLLDRALLAPERQAECGPEDRHAAEVVSFLPGTGACPDRSDPSAALGPPGSSPQGARGSANLGIGGSLTLALGDAGMVDSAGDDLRIWGDPGTGRSFVVEASDDGVAFEPLQARSGGTALDLDGTGLTVAWFVRISDDGSPRQQRAACPGAYLDAVEVLHCLSPESSPFNLEHVERLSRLEAGETRAITFAWTAAGEAEYTLVAEVDALGVVTESDEANNRFESLLKVGIQ